MDAIKKLNGMSSEIRAVQEKFSKQGRTLIGQAAKDILDAYPQVHGFQWRQYTPYFNDGDPCYFRVGDLHALIEDPEAVKEWAARKAAHDDKQVTAQGLSEEQREKLGVRLEEWVEPDPIEDLCVDGEDGGVYVSTYDKGIERDTAKYGEVWPHIVSFAKWLDADENKDVLESVFGDHKTITITRAGVAVENYDHD